MFYKLYCGDRLDTNNLILSPYFSAIGYNLICQIIGRYALPKIS